MNFGVTLFKHKRFIKAIFNWLSTAPPNVDEGTTQKRDSMDIKSESIIMYFRGQQ